MKRRFVCWLRFDFKRHYSIYMYSSSKDTKIWIFDVYVCLSFNLIGGIMILHSLSFVRNAWNFYTVRVFWTLTSRSLFAFLNFNVFLKDFIQLRIKKWNFLIIPITSFYFEPFLDIKIKINPKEIRFWGKNMFFTNVLQMFVP